VQNGSTPAWVNVVGTKTLTGTTVPCCV
jgi:hypothetical protein